MKLTASFQVKASKDSLFKSLPNNLKKDISVTADNLDILYVIYSNDKVDIDKTEKQLTRILEKWAKGRKAKVQLEEYETEIGLLVYKVMIDFDTLSDDEMQKINIKVKKGAR